MFEDNTFCTGAAFVPKQSGTSTSSTLEEEEDDGWVITFVHNEDTNISQVCNSLSLSLYLFIYHHCITNIYISNTMKLFYVMHASVLFLVLVYCFSASCLNKVSFD